MSVIWSVDNKENSQGLLNIPVWSVYTSRKAKKKITVHDRKQTKCDNCVCQFWSCNLKPEEAQRL